MVASTHSPWFFDDCQGGNVSVFWVWRPEVLSPCVSQLLTVSDSFGGLWETDYPEFRSCVFRPPGAARSWGKGWLNPGAEGWLGLAGSNQLPHPSSSLKTFGIKEHFQGPLLKISIYNIRGQWFLTFFGWIPCYSGTSFECCPQGAWIKVHESVGLNTQSYTIHYPVVDCCFKIFLQLFF